MPITLPEPGYDPRTGIYTSPDAPEIDETLGIDEAAAAWRALRSEFCFPEDDIDRSLSVTLAGALTPFWPQRAATAFDPARTLGVNDLFVGGCGKGGRL